MKIETHNINAIKIAEIVSDEILIKIAEDGLNLLGDLYYQGFEGILLHEKNIVADFFELKNGMAGNILQKFSNYRMRLTILGDFEKYSSKSLNDFIYESNKGRLVNFVATVDEALSKF